MRILSTFSYWIGEWWGLLRPPLVPDARLIAEFPVRNLVAQAPARDLRAEIPARNLVARY